MANRYNIDYDPYIDPETKILRNKIGARTQADLDAAESEITYVIIATLTWGSTVENLIFDADLLLTIHEEIFRDIYDWAGKVRTQDISKDGELFCHATYIIPSLHAFTTEITDDMLIAQGRAEFVRRSAQYYADLNAIHPFREGNGRAIRTFLRLLAVKYGLDINWDQMSTDENIHVSRESLHGHLEPITKLLDRIVVTLDYKKLGGNDASRE